MRRVRVIARGVVQGVGYRYAARSAAERTGVTGWVRNRGDDRVEAELEGPDAAVASMIEWMRHGPPGARVVELDVEDIASSGGGSFDIRETA